MKVTSKKLTRSLDERIVLGVCGGLANYFNIDVTIIRLFFVILTILNNGAGLLLYIVLAIITPNQTEKIDSHTKLKNKLKIRIFLGYIAIAVGLLMLINNLAPAYWQAITNKLTWPLLIICLGCLLVIKKTKL